MAQGMKQLAKDAAIYGLSSIVGRFLNWLLVPMYTRVLTDTGQFGAYTNLYAWAALLLVLLTYGMETGFFRFVNRKAEFHPTRVYATVLLSLAVTSALFLTVALLFLSPVAGALGYAHHPEYIGMMAGIVAVDAFCCLPFAWLRYQGKALRFAGLKLFGIFLNIFLNIFFLILCPRIHQSYPELVSWFYIPAYGVGYAFVANVITTAATLGLLLSDFRFALRIRPDWRLLKKIFRYSFPILILGIAGILNQTVDKILFPFLFEDKTEAARQLGIYGACFRIAVVMVMFIQAFRYAYEPFIFAKSGQKDEKTASAQAMKYFIAFALVIFLAVMFYLDLLKYFVAPAYYSGLGVVPVVMLGELFFGIYFNLSFWYKMTDETRWGAIFSAIGCAVTVSVILLFVPRYGFIACAWASVACNLLMTVLSYAMGQKKYPVGYDLRSALFYFTLAGILYAAGMLIVIPSEVFRLMYRTALLGVFIVFIIKRDLPLKQIPYIGRYFG